MFKADPIYSSSILLKAVDPIWKCRKVPKDWKKGIIVKVPKEMQDETATICVASHSYQYQGKYTKDIFIHKRMVNAIDDHLRKEQTGFRKGRGCADVSVVVKQFFQPLLLRNYCTEYLKLIYTASLYRGL